MGIKEKVTQALMDFVKGGDNSDTELLDKVLHQDFRITNNGFMGTPGVTVINKEQYLVNIKKKVFGGLPRKIRIDFIDESETIALVKIRLESEQNYFVSYNSLVLDMDGEWRLVNNHAVVSPK